MIIAGLQKSTLIDYPDKIACVVFLAVCNFRCPWCYSSELVLPFKIAKQPKISEQEFFNFLAQRVGKLDGVVICGGEPTVHKDLPKFIEKIKQMGFLVKLDTNGSNPKMLKELAQARLIDYIAMDIKASPENKIYESILNEGVKFSDIQESAEFLKNGKIDFEFRTTCVPGVHQKADFLKIAEWVGGDNVKYYLQNFLAQKTIDQDFESVRPFEKDFLEDVVKEIRPFFKECRLRA